MTELVIDSYNIGDGPDADKRADLSRISEFAKVICLQEAGDRTKMLKEWAADNGWVLWYNPVVPGSKSVPILYLRGYGVVSRGARMLMPRTYVGAGAGPSWAKAKAATFVRIDNTVIFNTHMTPSATREGREYRFRRLHYRAHVAGLMRLVRNRIDREREVVVVGDMNAPPSFQLLRPLREEGLRQHVDEDTRHHQIIDQIWSTRGLVVVKRLVIRQVSSDHHSPVITLKKRLRDVDLSGGTT